MASNLCNTGGLSNLLATLQGSSSNTRLESQALASVAKEVRSVLVADNTVQPRFATSDGNTLGTTALGSNGLPVTDGSGDGSGGNGNGSGGDGGSSGGGNTPETGTIGKSLSARGNYMAGLRNRIFLKYLGVDYESYNHHDIKYRSV